MSFFERTGLSRDQKLDLLILLVKQLLIMEGRDMTTLDEVLAAQDVALTRLTSNTSLVASIQQIVTDNKAQIAMLQKELSDAISTGSMAQVAAVADKMRAINAALDAENSAEAAIANTGVQLPPPPAPADTLEGGKQDNSTLTGGAGS